MPLRSKASVLSIAAIVDGGKNHGSKAAQTATAPKAPSKTARKTGVVKFGGGIFGVNLSNKVFGAINFEGLNTNCVLVALAVHLQYKSTRDLYADYPTFTPPRTTQSLADTLTHIRTFGYSCGHHEFYSDQKNLANTAYNQMLQATKHWPSFLILYAMPDGFGHAINASNYQNGFRYMEDFQTSDQGLDRTQDIINADYVCVLNLTIPPGPLMEAIRTRKNARKTDRPRIYYHSAI